MKYKKITKLLSLVLCCSFVVSSLGACEFAGEKKVFEPMEIEEVDTYSFDFIGGRNVMPITAYHGPHTYQYSAQGQTIPDYFTDEFMQKIADIGVNLVVATGVDYTKNTDKAKKLLELGNKYGVGMFLHDTTVNANLDDDTLSIEELDAQINQYINEPSCCGLYIIDEPANAEYYPEQTQKYISRYGKLFQNLDALNVFGYCNLYPMVNLGVKDKYDNYIKEFAETCKVKVLSYDKYPFENDNSLKNAGDWFTNLSIIRKTAEESNIPFWSFIQAGSQWNDAQNHFDTNGYYPEEGSFNWLVHTSLAFGAKGIQYFPLLQPYWFAYASTEPFDFERNGLIGAWGNKNRWYYYAQEINKQIVAVDEVLMNSVNKGIIISGKEIADDFEGVDYLIEGKEWRELKNVTGDLMIGCFNYQGKSAFYVVNYDNEYAQKVTLDFWDNYDMKVVQNAETKYVNTDALKLTLAAGEGVLIVME